jgi:hypothetical protein
MEAFFIAIPCTDGLRQNDTDHQVGAMISPLEKRTARRLWCIRLFGAIFNAPIELIVPRNQADCHFATSSIAETHPQASSTNSSPFPFHYAAMVR